MAFDFKYPTPLPSTKGWGPGYPDCQTDKIVPAAPFVGGVHEDIRELVLLLVGAIEERGFRFMTPGCWGFGCRGTKTSSGGGTVTPSFHSWGLALDINAPLNVFGSTRDKSQIARDFMWLVTLLREYGFFWLGPSIGDWMHFSFCGSPADAKDMTIKAREELGGDMGYTEFKQGWKAFRQGNPEPAQEGDEKFGWNAAAFASNNPKPGVVKPHTHEVVVKENG